MQELIDRAAASVAARTNRTPAEVLEQMRDEPELSSMMRKTIQSIAKQAIAACGANYQAGVREVLLEMLEQKGPFTYKTAAELMQLSHSRASNLLRDLVYSKRAHLYGYEEDGQGTRGPKAALYMAGRGPDITPARPGPAPRERVDPHQYDETPVERRRCVDYGGLASLNGSAGLGWKAPSK